MSFLEVSLSKTILDIKGMNSEISLVLFLLWLHKNMQEHMHIFIVILKSKTSW